ncbi:hypothetical protein PV02_01695 [Methanolobus chelungpuianus]|uniref:Uncharacterized protein n=1 Tax=Methanolobus chelungpuianus TaxID=502115 RepID=A0AAE3H955_9EURY|nr:hypothetical protein [Methanolobus chelungpuianus]
MAEIFILILYMYMGGKLMDDYNSSTVYFRCNICDFLFQEDPERFPVRCFQCGSENVSRA